VRTKYGSAGQSTAGQRSRRSVTRTAPVTALLSLSALLLAAACSSSAASSSGVSGSGSGPASASTVSLSKFTLLVPSAPGGDGDILSRALQPALSKALGVPVVVENQAGGNIIPGTETLVQSGGDCSISLEYQLQTLENNFIEKVPFTPADIVGINLIEHDYPALRVLKSSKWQTFADFLADAKANPGKISISVPVSTSPNAVNLEAIEKAAGVKFNIVAFGGSGGDARNALLGNHVDANDSNVYNGQGIASQTRVLAVDAPTNQWQSITDNAPTMASVLGQSIPYSTSDSGYGLSGACVKNHPATAKKIAAALATAAASQQFLSTYSKLGEEGLVAHPTYNSALAQAQDSTAKSYGWPSFGVLDFS
jgi:tripartite-type tricarboxylate transporter receptor subunit TctC